MKFLAILFLVIITYLSLAFGAEKDCIPLGAPCFGTDKPCCEPRTWCSPYANKCL
uniref:Venom peptide Es1a n=1 Tax=Ectomocoris sp. TaxID=3104572 RepID=A0AB38ZEE3_9HEMI